MNSLGLKSIKLKPPQKSRDRLKRLITLHYESLKKPNKWGICSPSQYGKPSSSILATPRPGIRLQECEEEKCWAGPEIKKLIENNVNGFTRAFGEQKQLSRRK
jgi:hypothetical protein